MKTVSIALAAALLSSVAGIARAQPFPTKPIRVIVPFGPGGVQDAVARSFTSELTTALGQSVVVENRPGAGGVVGTLAVARSAPDGYTLLLAGVSHSVHEFLHEKPPFNPVDDFTPVTYIGQSGFVLVVPATMPVNSVADLVKLARAKPGELNYASAGVGTGTHLTMAYLTSLTGIDMLHVPRKSGGDVLVELLAARTHGATVPINVGLPYANDQRVRMIAVTGNKRSKFLPQLPTVAESGIAGYGIDSWLGLLGPAGMARNIVERIDSEMSKILRSPAILERLDRQGIDAETLTSAQFTERLRKEQPRWTDIVKRSGLKPS